MKMSFIHRKASEARTALSLLAIARAGLGPIIANTLKHDRAGGWGGIAIE